MITGRSLLRWSLGRRRRDLVLSCLLFSLHQLCEAMVPVLIGVTVSQAVATGDAERIALWLGVLAVNFAVLSYAYRFGARASVRAAEHTAHQVRLRLTDRVLEPAGGADLPPGELLTRASSDADRIGWLAGSLASTVAAAAVLVATTFLLLRLSPVLAVMILVGTILLLLVVGGASRRLHRHSDAEQRTAAHAAILAEDLVRGLRVLKGIGAERAAADSYATASDEAVGASRRALGTQGELDALSTLFTGVYLAAVAAVGGYLALQGDLSLGALVAALGLAQFLLGPLHVVSGVASWYARALASADRVAAVLNTPLAVPDEGSDAAAATDLDVVVEAAWGRFVAHAGQLTGVVANDPAVAAQIPLLLAREHQAGSVTVGGVPADHLPLDDLRELVLVAPHDATLFPGTVGENLGGAAEQVLAASVADEAVAALAHGTQTDVGDRGETLSGGQRQRVALARALAAEAPVLVLHDPTTAVDAVTEDRIADGLRAVRTGRTTIVVTSSRALLARCDRVVRL